MHATLSRASNCSTEVEMYSNRSEACKRSNLLRDTLATRDQITADLAKGDAAALSEIQPVLIKLEETLKHS
jgi:hypothetical protein